MADWVERMPQNVQSVADTLNSTRGPGFNPSRVFVKYLGLSSWIKINVTATMS